MTGRPDDPKGRSAAAEREAKLAQALRANLRRRKAPRAAGEPEARADEEAEAGPGDTPA